MADIDLDNPGKIWASADNAAEYSFYVVAAKPWYNTKAFEANPNCVAGKDLFFKTSWLPDKSGHQKIDLTNEADGLRHKMGDEAVVKANLVCVATSKPDNEDPHKRMAVMEPCDLKKEPPLLKLTTQDDKKLCIIGEKLLFKIEIKGMQNGCTFEIEPPDAADVSQGQCMKTQIVELKGKKNTKFTLTAVGTTTGGNKKEEKLELECEGPKLVMKGMGYIEPS